LPLLLPPLLLLLMLLPQPSPSVTQAIKQKDENACRLHGGDGSSAHLQQWQHTAAAENEWS
jgi:hypothetical protein